MNKQKTPKVIIRKGCKHNNKKRLYERHKTKWVSTEYWICPDCRELLKIVEVKEWKYIEENQKVQEEAYY